MVEFKALSGNDGSWQALKDEWQRQCDDAEEDFAAYTSGSFPVIEALALGGEPRAGVYAFVRDGSHQALCQLNCSPLPGYDGPVLRARFMTLAPRFDFGDFPVEEYADVLTGIFAGVHNLSGEDSAMGARHIKFHLASPADRQFFAVLGTQLHRASVLGSVRVKGAWLYVTKNQ